MTEKLGSADIAGLMRREISNGSMGLHDRLPAERRLAERYGVARGTVREALAQLEADSYVETRAGSGTYVTYRPPEMSTDAIANANPLELIDARFALEPHICRLAILHGRRSDFDNLARLCDEMEASVSDPLRFSQADTEFHHALARTTGNTLLIWIINQINTVRSEDEWTHMRHVTLNADIINQYNIQHRAVLTAIMERQPERAASLMKEHLETARLSLTRVAET